MSSLMAPEEGLNILFIVSETALEMTLESCIVRL